jgi:hypothetical protein
MFPLRVLSSVRIRGLLCESSAASLILAIITSSMPTTPCIGVRNSCDKLLAYGFNDCAMEMAWCGTILGCSCTSCTDLAKC